MEEEKKLYCEFLINILNDYFLYKNHEIKIQEISEPLMGAKIKMDVPDMLAFFYLLEEICQRRFILEDCRAFWSIESISLFLLGLHDSRIQHIIRGEGCPNE